MGKYKKISINIFGAISMLLGLFSCAAGGGATMDGVDNTPFKLAAIVFLAISITCFGYLAYLKRKNVNQ